MLIVCSLPSIDRRTWKQATRWFWDSSAPTSSHTLLSQSVFKHRSCIDSNQDAIAGSLASALSVVKNCTAAAYAPIATRPIPTYSEYMQLTMDQGQHTSSSPAFSDSANSGWSAVRPPTQGLIDPCGVSDSSGAYQPLAPMSEMARWDCWSISETGVDMDFVASSPTPLCRCYPFFLAAGSEDHLL